MFGFSDCLPRKKVSACCLGMASVAALALSALAADTAADAVLAKLHAELTRDVSDLRGVACMESVERTRYAPRRSDPSATCGELITAANEAQRGAKEWHSRLRLDVTAGSDAENFALADASRFEGSDIGGMLHAADAGSGEFSTFLRNLVNGDGAPLQSRGVQQTPIGPLLSFGFSAPEDKSHFVYASASPEAPSAPIRTGYHGSLFIVPQSGDLKRLTLVAENAGDACRVQYSTDYTATRVGDREIIVPQSSAMDVIYRNGTELQSETYYSGCRRTGGNTATPAAVSGAPKPLPAGVRFKVRFQPPIDSATAATGDPVVGVIRTTVKDKQNGVIVHTGDRVHGRISLIEEYPGPQPTWNLAIVIETIERGVGEHGIDQGVEQPVSLAPLDDAATTPTKLKLRPPGGGYFIFHDQTFALDQRYETGWETR